MRVLAIDPGSNHMGFAVMDQYYSLLSYGVEVVSLGTYAGKFLSIETAMANLMQSFGPNEVAMERPFKAANRDTSALIVAARCVKDYCKRRKLPVYLYSPGQWKKGVTGNGNATKDDVAGCVHLLYPALRPGVMNDITDAIGIASHHIGMRKLEGMAK